MPYWHFAMFYRPNFLDSQLADVKHFNRTICIFDYGIQRDKAPNYHQGK